MKYTKFLFYLPPPLLMEARDTALTNGMTTSAFIRQSLARHIKSCRATDEAMREASTQ